MDRRCGLARRRGVGSLVGVHGVVGVHVGVHVDVVVEERALYVALPLLRHLDAAGVPVQPLVLPHLPVAAVRHDDQVRHEEAPACHVVGGGVVAAAGLAECFDAVGDKESNREEEARRRCEIANRALQKTGQLPSATVVNVIQAGGGQLDVCGQHVPGDVGDEHRALEHGDDEDDVRRHVVVHHFKREDTAAGAVHETQREQREDEDERRPFTAVTPVSVVHQAVLNVGHQRLDARKRRVEAEQEKHAKEAKGKDVCTSAARHRDALRKGNEGKPGSARLRQILDLAALIQRVRVARVVLNVPQDAEDGNAGQKAVEGVQRDDNLVDAEDILLVLHVRRQCDRRPRHEQHGEQRLRRRFRPHDRVEEAGQAEAAEEEDQSRPCPLQEQAADGNDEDDQSRRQHGDVRELHTHLDAAEDGKVDDHVCKDEAEHQVVLHLTELVRVQRVLPEHVAPPVALRRHAELVGAVAGDRGVRHAEAELLPRQRRAEGLVHVVQAVREQHCVVALHDHHREDAGKPDARPLQGDVHEDEDGRLLHRLPVRQLQQVHRVCDENGARKVGKDERQSTELAGKVREAPHVAEPDGVAEKNEDGVHSLDAAATLVLQAQLDELLVVHLQHLELILLCPRQPLDADSVPLAAQRPVAVVALSRPGSQTLVLPGGVPRNSACHLSLSTPSASPTPLPSVGPLRGFFSSACTPFSMKYRYCSF
eukprot:Rhum_TRINITY_DN9238_c0_g1::Rhum_TRINITY_DN9238_c0_g1_i1::g.32156::m.32156